MWTIITPIIDNGNVHGLQRYLNFNRFRLGRGVVQLANTTYAEVITMLGVTLDEKPDFN